MSATDFPIIDVPKADFPPLLREIPEPPERLRLRGTLPSPDMRLLAVVGSRQYTSYGKDVVEHLIGGLRGYNVGIVSGLALGIDSLAHEAALDASLYTLAIPGSGLSEKVLYPARHRALARRIVESGGGLLSEFADDFSATPWSFPRRNRLVCGMCQATLLIEAAPQSGTLITARLTVDYNRELLVVPGNIFYKNSQGVHQFLKLGATPVTSADDILAVLQIEKEDVVVKTGGPEAKLPALHASILNILHEPCATDEIIRALLASGGGFAATPTHEITTALMELELTGAIKKQGDRYRSNIT